MGEWGLLKIVLIVGSLCVFLWFLWRFSSRRYQLPCPSWLAWMVERDNPFTKINRASTIVSHMELQSGMHVVDIGCGPGRLTIPLARAVGPEGNVVAMDIQAEMLEKVKEKAHKENVKNIEYLQAGIGEHKLELNRFDRAALVTVLGEIVDQEAALREIYTALKPGGLLAVTEIIFDPHFQRSSMVVRRAQLLGFKEKKKFGSWYAFTVLLEKPH